MRFRRHQEAAQAGTRRLLVLFVLLLVLLVAAVNGALALAWHLSWPFGHGYPALFFETNTAIVLLFVLGGCAVESLRLAGGGAHVARLAGGEPARTDDRLERRLHNVVVEMALAANTRPPAAWVLPRETAINAFAAGWQEEDAVIAVTRGALERLDRAELQGVVAHELSHLVHGDTRLNMRLIGLVWGLRMVFDFGHRLVEPDGRGRRSAGVLVGAALMGAGAFGWVAGRLLQAAVSRQREFLADASAVKYTRQVTGLGGALRKIAEQQSRGLDRLHAAAGPLGHLFLARRTRWNPWAMHPPLAERIRRLYGRTMPGVPDDPVPAAADDEPLLPAFAAPIRLASAASLPVPDRMSAAEPALDVYHALLDRSAGDAERLQRIARWHSPLEIRASLLALLRADGAAWHGVPDALARTMAEELQALGPAARAAALDALARRAATAPRPWRAALLRDATATADAPTALLRWLLLRHLVRARFAPMARAGARRQLAASSRAAASATQALSLCLGLEGRHARTWQESALQTLGTELAPGSPFPSARDALAAALRLQRLPALQKPRLVRAWVQALDGGADTASARIALAQACALLDLSAPPELAGALAAWPDQERSL
jgi:Zn-dependent protease with chaperone function